MEGEVDNEPDAGQGDGGRDEDPLGHRGRPRPLAGCPIRRGQPPPSVSTPAVMISDNDNCSKGKLDRDDTSVYKRNRFHFHVVLTTVRFRYIFVDGLFCRSLNA